MKVFEVTALAEQSLARARTRLVMERPFLGALVVHLPMVASTRCQTIATDARAIYFNAHYIALLAPLEVQFVLAHAALHCALLHTQRRGTRLRQTWDQACDYAVNQLLVDDGLKAPAGALVDVRFRGLTAEAIYPMLDANLVAAPLDEHWFDGAPQAHSPQVQRSDHSPVASDRDAAFEVAHAGLDELGVQLDLAMPVSRDRDDRHDLLDPADWSYRLEASALEAAAAGRLGAHWRNLISGFAQPSLPWRELLARFVMTLGRDDFTFARMSRRGGEGEGAAILPGVAGDEVDLVVALDTSGSIGPSEFREFAEALDLLKGQIRARVTLVACDAKLAAGAPWYFQPWERLEIPNDLRGGGSTRFTPVFDWVEAEGLRPSALVYFTDAQGEFPEQPPGYPVLWLVKGNSPVPWGERVQLN